MNKHARVVCKQRRMFKITGSISISRYTIAFFHPIILNSLWGGWRIYCIFQRLWISDTLPYPAKRSFVWKSKSRF